MSKWISLSGASSGNKVMETSRHNYVIFEVPVGQKATFQLDTDRLRSLQSRKHRMYFVAQGMDAFGEESWLEWKSGPAPMALHEYFNHLNGGKADYTPESVKQVAHNYITVFETGENGQTDWSRPRYPSYTPERAGQGIWLESLYYSPDWAGMGAFIIGVDQPGVLSLFAKKREFRMYDPDENFIREDIQSLEGIRYGDTVDLHIETHRIIPGRYGAEVEILYQGTRIYNGKKRLDLDRYANSDNPALEYNLQMKESLFVDPAWKEATGHPDGTTQDYTVRFTFNPKDVLENRTDGGFAPGSPVIRDFTLKVSTTIFDFIMPRLGLTPQIVSVKEETLTPIDHEECRFSALKVIVKDQEPIEILRENKEQGFLATNLIHPVIPVVAGNGDDQEVTIQLEGVHTEECGEKPSHHNNIFVYDEAVGTWSPEESGDKLVLRPRYEYPGGVVGMNNPIALLSYIWPKRRELTQNYSCGISTCRYSREVRFNIHPDIEWELEFKWNHDAPFYYGFSNGLTSYSIDKDKAIGSAVDSGFASDGEMLQSFEWSLKATWNNGEDEFEVGDKFLEGIRKTLSLFARVKTLIDNITTHLRGNMPMSLEIESPAIAASAKWKLEKTGDIPADSPDQIATLVTVGASAKPLVGATFTIDLISAAATTLSPGVTKVIEFVRTKAKDYVEVVFEVRFSGNIEVDGKVDINTLLPERSEGEITVTGEIKLEIELSASGSTGEVAAGSFEAEIEAGITGEASVKGGVEGGADREGVYIVPVAEFGGVIATFVLKGSVRFGIIKRTFDKSPPDAEIVPPDKIEFEKNYLNE
ncbi:bactofilin family protein [Sinomicrobium soli]|uniref:hypothetical protein n=1 Tax=Sinomicrobium sp. N-1-3-6 TaxID=2219864 RepID=UPI000DCAFF00|nr:hypothetical protein [Sinomicrobium sp. N-1-3-6]RAV30762.1 hypothetical protein DN748_00440 [Sinomicrobium sp. N-1-3-6]